MTTDDKKGETASRQKVSFSPIELAEITRAAASAGMKVASYIREITVRRTATVLTAVRRTKLAVFADQQVILSDLGRILGAIDFPPHVEIEIVECLARLEATLQPDGEDELQP